MKDSPLHRFIGIVLDEFAELKPKSEECCRLVASWMLHGHTSRMIRIAIAGYTLSPEYISSILGNHQLLVCPGRKYSLERCVVAPSSNDNLLRAMATVALLCFTRTG